MNDKSKYTRRLTTRKFSERITHNPYVNNNWVDLSKEVHTVTEKIKSEILKNPDYYAELVADMFFQWKHNTFETPLMFDFKEKINL